MIYFSLPFSPVHFMHAIRLVNSSLLLLTPCPSTGEKSLSDHPFILIILQLIIICPIIRVILFIEVLISLLPLKTLSILLFFFVTTLIFKTTFMEANPLSFFEKTETILLNPGLNKILCFTQSFLWWPICSSQWCDILCSIGDIWICLASAQMMIFFSLENLHPWTSYYSHPTTMCYYSFLFFPSPTTLTCLTSPSSYTTTVPHTHHLTLLYSLLAVLSCLSQKLFGILTSVRILFALSSFLSTELEAEAKRLQKTIQKRLQKTAKKTAKKDYKKHYKKDYKNN